MINGLSEQKAATTEERFGELKMLHRCAAEDRVRQDPALQAEAGFARVTILHNRRNLACLCDRKFHANVEGKKPSVETSSTAGIWERHNNKREFVT